MTPDFQSPTLFLLGLGLLQALLIMIVLLVKGKKNRLSSIYLVLLILTITVLLLCKILSKSWLWTYAQNFYLTAYFIPYLIGPFLFLYVRQSLQSRQSFVIRDLLHFVPFLFFVADQMVYSAVGISLLSWIPTMFWKFRSFQLVTQISSISLYGFLSLSMIDNHRWSASHYFSNQEQVEMGWLKQLAWMVTLCAGIGTATLHVMSFFHPYYTELRWIFLLLPVLIYWITYKAISEPLLLFQGTPPADQSRKEKYAGSGLNEDQALLLLGKLTDLMEKQKSFLDPGITVERLSKLVGFSRHHISQALNEKAGKSFYDFINEYRVTEAKRMLNDPRKRHLSLAGIGAEAGFNSVSSFNLVFKKHCGMTPSQFKVSITAELLPGERTVRTVQRLT